MTFKASLDGLAKGITGSITVLFVLIIGVQISVINNISIYILVGTIILLSAIYWGAFLYRPLSYTLTTESIVINRPLTDIKIDRKEIKNVEKLDNNDLSGTIRTFGVGGLFGYWGRFCNKKMGCMTWYATRRKNAVLITTNYNKKIVLTPDDPEQFVLRFN